MSDVTLNDRLTKLETRSEEYVKHSDISATLARIETKLDNQKWLVGVIVAIFVSIGTGITVGLIMLALQGASGS